MSQMTEQMFNDRLKEIEDAYRESEKNLLQEYALLNAKFKKGDIIKDNDCSILVTEAITLYSGNTLEIIYEGFIVNKDSLINDKKTTSIVFEIDATLVKPHNP